MDRGGKPTQALSMALMHRPSSSPAGMCAGRGAGRRGGEGGGGGEGKGGRSDKDRHGIGEEDEEARVVGHTRHQKEVHKNQRGGDELTDVAGVEDRIRCRLPISYIVHRVRTFFASLHYALRFKVSYFFRYHTRTSVHTHTCTQGSVQVVALSCAQVYLVCLCSVHPN
jgi:hypothetical protein